VGACFAAQPGTNSKAKRNSTHDFIEVAVSVVEGAGRKCRRLRISPLLAHTRPARTSQSAQVTLSVPVTTRTAAGGLIALGAWRTGIALRARRAWRTGCTAFANGALRADGSLRALCALRTYWTNGSGGSSEPRRPSGSRRSDRSDLAPFDRAFVG
jgi:hypothetical protein